MQKVYCVEAAQEANEKDGEAQAWQADGNTRGVQLTPQAGHVCLHCPAVALPT